jgi:hypothetical protein
MSKGKSGSVLIMVALPTSKQIELGKSLIQIIPIYLIMELEPFSQMSKGEFGSGLKVVV